MSPPLSMREHWFAPHTAYTIAKYGMSMCTLGHAGEFRPLGIAVNSLWPRTAIKTAALQMIPGVDIAACRTPEILADAAWFILTSDAKTTSGNFFIDDTVLARARRHRSRALQRHPGDEGFRPRFLCRLTQPESRGRPDDRDDHHRRQAAIEQDAHLGDLWPVCGELPGRHHVDRRDHPQLREARRRRRHLPRVALHLADPHLLDQPDRRHRRHRADAGADRLAGADRRHGVGRSTAW